ncbi:hypothetical protein [Peptostreptococcus canis]|uniref:Uncharacterized protein n=1 Tax=Peptostreptococcus canis TaxID=1159213 RepID=A0ABR6TK95_9FIRM|nr:hypothetical protein [Peptostreptococcus canis]MBC2575835.1 hypothetical protein [Peptostreptococcus canis]
MRLKFDREIMKWFDSFFENRVDMFNIDNFLCSLQDFETNLDSRKVIVLQKENSNYWKLEFSLPDNYVVKLKKNVHPIFGQYIFDEISIYSDDIVYDKINSYIMKIINNIIEIKYDLFNSRYLIDYREEFIDICNKMVIGERNLLIEDVYMIANTNSDLDFLNYANTFKLNLSFNPDKGEDLIDSILDLRRSIIVRD